MLPPPTPHRHDPPLTAQPLVLILHLIQPFLLELLVAQHRAGRGFQATQRPAHGTLEVARQLLAQRRVRPRARVGALDDGAVGRDRARLAVGRGRLRGGLHDL